MEETKQEREKILAEERKKKENQCDERCASRRVDCGGVSGEVDRVGSVSTVSRRTEGTEGWE